MKNKIRIITLFTFYFSLFTLLTGCKGEDYYATFTGHQQGTVYSIVAKNPTNGLEERIDGVFELIDNSFSMFNAESLTSRINRNETDLTTPLFDECFAIAKKVHALTDGYYDPTVKPLVDMWGFGPGEQQEHPCVECVMEYVGLDKIRIEGGRIVKEDPRVQLDFSSIAKGFTVDRLAELLESEGVKDYMVDVGGEMRVKGVNAAGRKWRIGIKKPVNRLTSDIETVVTFGDRLTSIATSGNYLNWFTDTDGRVRVHTVDPKTGFMAIGNVLSVSIVGPDCATADAWATGLMAAHDIERVKEMLPTDGPEFYIIYSEDDEELVKIHSKGFPFAGK